MEYTPEQLNYFRLCHIVFNLVPEGLRSVFKQEWDFLYKTLPLGEWKDTPQNGLDFYTRESPKSHTRNARCLATIQNGNTAEWDCTCLFFAILYSDSIGITLSPAIRTYVDDIRQVRNDVAHINEAELTDAEFQNRVGKVIAAFNHLKLPVTDVEAVKNQTSFPTAEVNNLNKQANYLQVELRRAKSDLHVVKNTLQTKEDEVENLAFDLQEAKNTLQTKEEEVETLACYLRTKEEEVDALIQEINSKVVSFCNLTFKPSHEIIRRSTDVTRIQKKMAELEDGSNGAVSTVYLSGNPGCGKSQIARQLGQEFFDKRSHESEGLTFVATLNVETLETLADSYNILAKQLGVTEFTLTSLATSKVKSAKEIVQHLKSLILPKIKQFSNWLIIADNVVDLSLVRSDLPPTGSKEWSHGQVLITTQDSSTIPCDAPHTFHESLSKGMQPDDAVELLKEISQIKNHEKAETVAETLEYQPLALAAAAVYIRTVVSYGSPNYSWSSYLESLERGERKATEETLAQQNPAYSKTMTAAVKMAIHKALETDEVLRELFRFISLCASDSLPIEAVVNFVKGRTTGQTEELIRAKILKSSLITCLHVDSRVPFYLKVHKIVHEVLKTISMSDLEVTERAQCVSAAAKILHSLIEADRKLMRASRHASVKLRIITTHCKALHKILNTDFAVKDIVLTELTHSVTPGNVVEWLCSSAYVCCELSTSSDANMFSTSASDFVKYICSSQKGNLLEAEVFYVRGMVFEKQRDHQLSLSFFEKAKDLYIAIYGEEHAKTANCYNQLGFVLCCLKQCNAAKKYFEKSLRIRKEIYGEKHPDIAKSYNGLGILYGELGQHDQAKEYYEKALAIAKGTSGGENRDVACSYFNLARDHRKLGKYNEAKECDEKALIISKKIYDEDHPDVALSYNNLACDYRGLGQYNEAKECDEMALIIRKKIYDKDHPDVARSYNNLASDYRELGEYNKAKECNEKALIISKKIYDEDHPDVARSYDNLACNYGKLGQYNEAKECDEKALMISKKIYDENHPDVARSYGNLACDYRKLGQYNKATECDDKALIIRKKIYDEDHLDVAWSYFNLARDHRKLGQYNEAKECDKKALIIRKKIYHENHPDVARSYDNLACDYGELGQYSEAKECDEKALVIKKKIYGENHTDVADGYNNLASDYRELGQYNEAKECSEKALIISKKIYDKDHPDVARSYDNLACDYGKLRQYNEAKECDKKALITRKMIYDEDHLDVAWSCFNLARDLRKLGQYNEAKECDEMALITRKMIYDEDHLDVAWSYFNLARDHRKLGKYNKAKECDEKALIIRKKIYHENHPDVARSYDNLACDYGKLGQYNEAKECDEKALIIKRKIHHENHPDVARSYDKFACDYGKLGQYNEAKECDEKALITRMKMIYDEDHLDVAWSYFNLARDHRKLGQYNEAKECDEKALIISTKIHDEDHPDEARGYNNLACDCRGLGQYNEDCDGKALIISKKNLYSYQDDFVPV